MPGRPRTMARIVQQLFELQTALLEELQRITPDQYMGTIQSGAPSQHQGEDFRATLWRSALDGVGQAQEYLDDLAGHLQFQVEQADRARAATAPSALLDDVDDDLDGADEIMDDATPAGPCG